MTRLRLFVLATLLLWLTRLALFLCRRARTRDLRQALQDATTLLTFLTLCAIVAYSRALEREQDTVADETRELR